MKKELLKQILLSGITVVCATLLVVGGLIIAGNIDSPAVPSNDTGRMYTLEQIYDYLDTGAAPTKNSGGFQQPSAGPASTMYTLDNIKSKIDTNAFKLPKTGQTTSYPNGNDTDRDDGYYQKGSPISPRFVDNGDGTITDRVTNLMWAKDGNGTGCNDGSKITWADAITYCEGLDFAGHTDWRLPNYKELVSILDLGTFSPAINATYFPNTRSDGYWSSTTDAFRTGYAWVVYFFNGYVYDYFKTYIYYIRCVRQY